jgi:hypothetical protein
VILSKAGRKLPIVLCLVLVALLAAPATPAGAATWPGRYSIWRNGAFATQYLDASCVGASIQIMLNLIDNKRDRSKGRQVTFLAYAAAHSKYPVTDGGADPQGWAQALVHFGAGSDYGWTTAATMQTALQTAAKQLRETGKPVGLLVHLGRHAWIMSGFAATADPQLTDSFDVTAAEVVGPLWPLGTLNGLSFDPGPGTWISTHDLARKFDAYTEPGQPVWYGKYVTVVPRVSDVGQAGGAGAPAVNGAPDIKSPMGWLWLLDRLAQAVPVRDFLWLH